MCAKHRGQQRANSDRARGSASERGYGEHHRGTFRNGVFAMWGDTCVWDVNGNPCGRDATHADHHPHSRRELVALGHDPDDPQHGRPLCEHHHNRHTGMTQGRLAKGRK